MISFCHPYGAPQIAMSFRARRLPACRIARTRATRILDLVPRNAGSEPSRSQASAWEQPVREAPLRRRSLDDEAAASWKCVPKPELGNERIGAIRADRPGYFAPT